MLNTLEREPDNQFDRYTVKVVAPPLNRITPNLRDNVKRGRDGQKCIGCLPRHLSKLISCGLDRSEIRGPLPGMVLPLRTAHRWKASGCI